MSTAHEMLTNDLGSDLDEWSVVFDFLGTTVRATAADIGQIQYWCAVYGDFRVPQRPADVTVTVHDPRATDRPAVATIEAAGRMRMWNGREPLLPPLREPGLNDYLYLQAVAIGRLGHAVVVLGGNSATRTALSLACTVRGAGHFGCDIVPIDLEDLLAMPWPKSLALGSEALSVLNIPGSHPSLMPFQTRAGEVLYRVPPSAVLGPRMCKVAADIAAIVVLTDEAGESRPHLGAVGASEGFECLLRHLAVRPSRGDEAADSLIRLCSRVPVHTLSMGSLSDSAAALDKLLA